MFKRVILVAAAIIVLAAITVSANAAYTVSAESAIVIEAESGTVLFEKNANNRMLIASTTKIMTALITLENSKCNDKVTINKECENVEGSSMYLKAGDTFTVQELLYGLMLESGNDAAVALAYHVSGGIPEFCELMNERAVELGCVNTHFSNPHGLNDSEHYSTASDLAKIMAEAMKNEHFKEIVSTKNVSIGGRTYSNHNKLLRICDGVIGGKTGYTKAAGRTLVSCAERNGMRLICVTLNAPDDWNDHMTLYDGLYSKWEIERIFEEGELIAQLPVISGTKESVDITIPNSEQLLVKKEDNIEAKIYLPEFVYAPVSKGDFAGYISILCNGEEISCIELFYPESIEVDKSEKMNFWDKLERKFGKIVDYGMGILGYSPESNYAW